MATASPATNQSAFKFPPIDYTSRDYQSIVDDMVKAIPFFTPEWTDHNATDFGIVLLQLEAMVTDVLHFYVDRHLNEAFWGTALVRRSMINLAKLIDYKMRSAVAATADVEFELGGAITEDLIIPAGTRVSTAAESGSAPVTFELIADAVIPLGSVSVTASVREGESKSETAGVSAGIPRQKFPLSGGPILDGSLGILIDEGIGDVLWVEVETFVNSRPDDQHFVTQRDEFEVVTVFFGDNAQGKIPDATSIITARYRIGGGLRGNVGALTITSLVDIPTLGGSPVLLRVSNPAQASGGEDRQSVEDARVQGPRSLRALGRWVSEGDGATLAESFPGVAKAKVIVRGTIPIEKMGCFCFLGVVIAPVGGGKPTAALKAELTAFLEPRKMAGTCFEIVDPEYQPIDMVGKVTMFGNFATDQVVADTDDAIDSYFDLVNSDAVQFGQGLFLSDLYRLMDSVSGVDHVDLTRVVCRPLPAYEIWSSDAKFGDVVSGDSAVDETWTVIMTSPTTFSVRGSVTGLQVKTGTLGVLYTSDGGQVSFTLVAGTKKPCTGERATFRTCASVGNVGLSPTQIMVKGSVSLTFVGGARTSRPCPR